MRDHLSVLFVAPVAVEGGVAEVLSGIVRHAPAAGIAPSVLFLHPGPAAASLSRICDDVTVTDIGRLRSPRTLGRGLRAVTRALRTVGPDVVVAMEPGAQLYTALPARARRVPVVWQQHAIAIPASAVDRVARRLPADLAIANSNFVAGPLRSCTRVPVRVVRPGIDVAHFAAADGSALRTDHEITDDEVLVGIVGRLQPWKGQHLFLEMAEQVAARCPTARFVVVGGAEMGWETGDYPGDLRRLAGELGIADRVIFAGQVDDTAPWMAACDVVVSASSAEPYGLVLCEAQAAGAAVVAVAEGGPLEIVESGVDGVTVDRSASALAEAVAGLVGDRDRRHTLARAGARKAEATHDAARMANALAGELRRVVR